MAHRERASAAPSRSWLAVLTVTGQHRHLGAVRRHAGLRPRRDALRQRDERRHPRRRQAPAARSRERLHAGRAGHDRQLHRDAHRRRAVRRLARAAAVGRARPATSSRSPSRSCCRSRPRGRCAMRDAGAGCADRSRHRGRRADRPSRWPTPLADVEASSAREAISYLWHAPLPALDGASSPRSSARRLSFAQARDHPLLPRRARRRPRRDRLRHGRHRRRRAGRLARGTARSSSGFGRGRGHARREPRRRASASLLTGLAPEVYHRRSPPTRSVPCADLGLERAVGRAASADRARRTCSAACSGSSACSRGGSSRSRRSSADWVARIRPAAAVAHRRAA